MTPQPKATGHAILVVDAHDDSRETLGELLGEEGYVVETCRTGREALGRLRRPPRPDLLVLEHLLPDMNGDTLLDSLERRGVYLPILLYTVASPREVRAVRRRVSGYMLKPAELERILYKIQRALDGRSSSIFDDDPAG